VSRHAQAARAGELITQSLTVTLLHSQSPTFAVKIVLKITGFESSSEPVVTRAILNRCVANAFRRYLTVFRVLSLPAASLLDLNRWDGGRG
jgi:hypothetical protein